MIAEIAVIVPVLCRPASAGPLAESLAGSVEAGRAQLYFVCTEADVDEVAACEATGADVLVMPGEWRPGDWGRKIGHGYRHTTEPLMLLGGDDVRFRPGWLDEVQRFAWMGAGRRYGVIGTMDCSNPRVQMGLHSTHPVVARWYADELGTVDGPGRVVVDAYRHNFVDTELVATAKARNLWVFARAAVIEHLHPHFRPEVATDATYELGQSSFDQDRATFLRREHLWAQP